MTFEEFTGPEESSGAVQHPRLTIYANGDGRVNAAADRQFFADAEVVTFLADPEGCQLAIRPGDGEKPYAISRAEGEGGDISTTAVLREQLHIDIDALDETTYHDLAWDDDLGAAVADLSDLPQRTNDESTTAQAPDATDGVTPALIQRAVDQGYDSVDDIAEMLGTSTGEVRRVAMDADIYSAIDDNPGGYGRGGA